uniref:TLDc domain-containing protein n=1 Tax=Rhizophagus irregularis (strain DAOM 181602 / DAOM 197198 / MUCL 43194) TaxID=747089 RepID=U9UFX6_RHIID
MEQNFSLIYQTSFENDSFSELQNFCTDLISKQPEKIFSSPDFTSISEESLTTLIQHDNLQMSGVQVWEYVLKWGIAQNPELSSDPSSYSKDNFNALTNTLQSSIPFVKFIDFTPKEFFDKVYPYKKIIPEELLDDLFKYFLNYDYNSSSRVEPQIIKEISSKSIDSKIESFQNVHVEIISKWIDRLEVTDEIRKLYEFKLILRGSRDGLTPKKFHEICDNQSHTVVIFKNKFSNRIFGGYNPIIWASNDTAVSRYGETKDSFIFSFENDGDIENHILSRVIDEKHAIYYYSGYGPSFGGEDFKTFGNELTVACYKTYYEKSIKCNSSVEEYEVFQINI